MVTESQVVQNALLNVRGRVYAARIPDIDLLAERAVIIPVLVFNSSVATGRDVFHVGNLRVEKMYFGLKGWSF